MRKNSAELGIPIGPISAGGSAGGTPWVSTKNDLMGECSMGFSTSQFINLYNLCVLAAYL